MAVSAGIGGERSSPGRIEDGPLLRGEGRFVGDLRIPGTLHLAVVRSPFARGRLASVDIRPALAIPGVVDAFSARDVAQFLQPIPSRIPIPDEATSHLQPPLADRDVRYVGQPVAAVVALDPTLARDAAEAVEVEIDTAPADAAETILSEGEAYGDVDVAFETADVVVRGSFEIGRQAGMPIEPRGLLADFDPDSRRLDVWAAAKAPQHLRAYVASTLGLDESQVEVRPVDVGGGFGTRGEIHPEDALVPIAAFRLGRPVSWIETRLENFQVAYQSRGQSWEAAVALRTDGTILGLSGAFRSDLGAYVGPNGLTAARIALKAFVGPYRVPAYGCRVDHVRTCKVPLGTVRGPGYLEAGFVRERLVDMAAAELEIDAAEIRRRNLVGAGEMPYSTGLPGVVYDGGDYPGMLARAVEESTTRSARPGLQGLGLSCTVEAAGTPGLERAVARLERSGRVTVELASSSFGQGHATAFGKIAAAAIGLDRSLIDVVEGDTRTGATGGGTFASRTTMMVGSACLAAATALRQEILARAVERLGPEAQLVDGRIDGVGESLELGLLAPLAATGEFSCAGPTFTFGASAARVAVDAETGEVTLLDLVVVADAGHVVDLQSAQGQLRGGAVQGAGAALFELLEHDDGEPLIVSMRDYHVPSFGDVPDVTVVVLEQCPSPANPLGARGLGEIATAGAAAAVANAVADALRGSGIEVTQLPLAGERLISRPELRRTDIQAGSG